MDTGRRTPDDARHSVHALRTLDLSEIRAVGFDLDHTLAVYDDERVNAIACEETCEYLVDAGYPRSLRDLAYDETSVCRGLSIDTARGCVVKLDGSGRARRASRGGAWVECDDEAVQPEDELHGILSHFDLPTAFLFDTISTGQRGDHAAVCRDVRTHLDRAHTRGDFKRRVLADLSTLVRPLSITAGLRRLRDDGKRLFVVTNSEEEYTAEILDYLIRDESGRSCWRDLFGAVAAGADKPRFFEGGAAAGLEARLGASGSQVLYVGDHPLFDAAAASAFGWRTALVVPELASPEADATRWGSPLWESGRPSWFSTLITRYADAYATRVEAFLEPSPRARLEPRGEGPLGDSA